MREGATDSHLRTLKPSEYVIAAHSYLKNLSKLTPKHQVRSLGKNHRMAGLHSREFAIKILSLKYLSYLMPVKLGFLLPKVGLIIVTIYTGIL